MESASDREVLLRRLEMATRAARIGVWEWTIDTGLLYWSPLVFEMLGVAREDFGGRLSDFVDRVVPEDRERVAAALEAHLEQGALYQIEFEMFHSSGRRVTIEGHGEASYNGDGARLMLGSVRDISDRRNLQRRLLEAERIAHIGHWIVDVRDNTLSWSPETFRIHGMPAGAPQPDVDRAMAFYHPDDLPLIARAFERVMQDGVFRAVDARLQLDDGRIRHVHVNGRATLGSDGAPERLFGVVHDRTEAVKKERELTRARRVEAFGQLAGGVAHDFNNLLSVVLGNLELLQDSRESLIGADDGALIDAAVGAIVRGRELTQSLLSFARSAPLRPEPTAPAELVSRLESVLRRTLPASLTLEVDVAEPASSVFVDRGNLDACLLNLVINARDAIDKSGRICLTVRETEVDEAAGEQLGLVGGSYVVFGVTDDGQGISDADLQRVFEPFFTTKSVGKGSGLGLPRVRGFAEQSGGTVDIESRLGEGTSVWMYLPAAADHAAEPRHDSEVAAGVGERTVLLVEDVDAVRRVVAVQLVRAGHRVISAPNGAAALSAFRENPDIDLIVSDLVMPGNPQGPELVARIREARPGIPVVYMSGYSREFAEREYGVGSTEQCLMKPVTATELRAAIRRAVS